MSGAHARLEGVPEVFPVFPLTGAVLFPGGRLPLNIFEPRYLAMVDDAMGAGRLFGMIQPLPDVPRTDSGPALHRIGCLGRITAFSETEDGRYLITLTGLMRFEVVEEAEMRRGYRRVQGDVSAFRDDVDPLSGNPVGDEAPVTRAMLVEALRHYFEATGIDANWDAIEEISDEALIVTLCMACPFSPAEKQALLEAKTDSARAEALLAILEINARRG
ncbi:MAG TPA: LON peptidase substrate-binding domain-containing protein [Acidiphilium sp.]|uniref:LON peptidase substrate-binding domain-containing protein n=1 Tax=unclassified Acidiphilium TaxID=2617493 RepID=UPI000BD29138|nr:MULTISPECIES: LON peptidase substrate-binding domain-containing protein [unclassified Acidiphilium]OYV57152.1 MAG: peptidase S16 [Acidiphilium sp. 20-67-58]OYV83469.1 MAG: peptidase S16 [Acidiphilium sp. 21-68-69]HQT60722.1 LON peptidase substrate-binding domain-containing protein [Acidiphilium sp.]HQU10202.1 LON peptidase substrate-binding domain-containing protein [Acidiphilium sp.]